ncbi:MAG: hypothetical protein K0R24_467 [Gammaproteobacteria bacterium]|nr:hypothetical protein [Gammaproteobacteria bacterium]
MKKNITTCLLSLFTIGGMTVASAWGPDSLIIVNNTDKAADISWSTSTDPSNQLFTQFQNEMPKAIASGETIERNFSVNNDPDATTKFKQENPDIFIHIDFKDGICEFQMGNNQAGSEYTEYTSHFSKDTEIMISVPKGSQQASGHCKVSMTDDSKVIFTIN